MSYSLDTSYEMSTAGLLPEGDRVQASSVEEHLLIVRVLDRVDGIDTKHKANASAVVLDIWDLSAQANYVNVCWFNGAIVDNLGLERYIGGNPVAIKLVGKKGKQNTYLVPEPAQGQDLETAKAWLASQPDVFDQVRQQRGLGQYDRGMAAGTVAAQPQAPQAAFGAAPAAPAPAPAPAPAAPAAPAQAPTEVPQPQAPAAPAGPPPVQAPMEVPQPQAAAPAAAPQAPTAPAAPAAPAGPSSLPF